MKNSIVYFSLSVFCLLAFVHSRPLAPQKVVWAVDCGSQHSHRAEQGFVYDQDHGYDGDTYVIDYKNNEDYKDVYIYFSDKQHIYQSSRYGKSDFSYFLPLEEETNYVIILKFVEMYYRTKGKRVFNIKLGDRTIVENLDILDKQERFRIHEEYIDIRYSKKQILYKNQPCENALINNMIQLTFVKTDRDDPMVAALIMYKGDLTQTDHFEKEMYREQWFKDYKQRVKTQIQQKNNQTGTNMTLQDFAEEVRLKHNQIGQVLHTYEEIETHPPQREIPPLQDLLMTPMGIVLMIGFFAVSFVLITTTFFGDSPSREQSSETNMQSDSPLPMTKVSPQFQKKDSKTSQPKNVKNTKKE